MAMKTNLELLRGLAARQVAQYPQYAGHHDAYVMVRIKRDVTTKMGRAFTKGEIVIASKVPAFPRTSVAEFVTCWSFSNAIDTSVPAGAVEWLS